MIVLILIVIQMMLSVDDLFNELYDEQVLLILILMMITILIKIIMKFYHDHDHDSNYDDLDFRDHICHKQYKQRLCKIIITRVKVHFVDVF